MNIAEVNTIRKLSRQVSESSDVRTIVAASEQLIEASRKIRERYQEKENKKNLNAHKAIQKINEVIDNRYILGDSKKLDKIIDIVGKLNKEE